MGPSEAMSFDLNAPRTSAMKMILDSLATDIPLQHQHWCPKKVHIVTNETLKNTARKRRKYDAKGMNWFFPIVNWFVFRARAYIFMQTSTVIIFGSKWARAHQPSVRSRSHELVGNPRNIVRFAPCGNNPSPWSLKKVLVRVKSITCHSEILRKCVFKRNQKKIQKPFSLSKMSTSLVPVFHSRTTYRSP